ncbi:MAG: hypothetical protein ABL914_11345 [Novosphingobium sp.]|uniref:hypothetical protein n=1 Tax=Novosphingobium sp. TaxID=1874826 RepID=UPI0032BB27E2
MAGLLSFALAAVVAVGGAPAAGQGGEAGGAQVRVSATVTILRAERASESAAAGGLARHVSRHSDGSVAIVFE